MVSSRPDFLLNARSAGVGGAGDTQRGAVAQLLIVEDDAGLRDVLVRSLRAEGFGARGVATGADAARPRRRARRA